MFPQTRMRRLRRTENIRAINREIRLSADDFIYPIFVIEGENIKNAVSSMPGVYQFSLDRLLEEVERAVQAGIKAIIFFGIPADPVSAAGKAVLHHSGSPALPHGQPSPVPLPLHR